MAAVTTTFSCGEFGNKMANEYKYNANEMEDNWLSKQNKVERKTEANKIPQILCDY